MRQKLITLCPESFKLSKRKANFSKWVRMTLIKEEEIIEELDALFDEVAGLKDACAQWANRYYDVLENNNIVPPGFENIKKVTE